MYLYQIVVKVTCNIHNCQMLEKHWVLMTINKIYFYGFEYD